MKGSFGVGKFRADDVLIPVNARGKIIDLTEQYRSVGAGCGLYFSAKKPMQTLAVLETRYFNVQDIYPYTIKEMYLAQAIANLWADEHFRPCEERVATFTDEQLALAWNEFLRDASSKNYASKYDRSMGYDSPDGRVVRFHLKSNFKQKMNPDL